MSQILHIGMIWLLVLSGFSGDINEAVDVLKPIELISLDDVPEPACKITQEPTPILFRVTAYCACEKCCGSWADNRPLDQNGNSIVYGASGVELKNKYSCASPLDFGTIIDLEGIGEVEVQDRTSDWVVEKYGQFIIDIYFNDHEEALNFGVQYIEGVIK